ncbi:MAG: alpha/beta fold hydrolase [Armatimonadetes bacterium]|nr:alpha/beta fold hydrolase [Armatimonadota bacterium]
MPVIERSTYEAPLLLWNGHLQTVLPTLFRRVPAVRYRRVRVETPDGDFLDVDWADVPHARGICIVSHGLEGNSDGKYIRGMVRALNADGWTAVAWNYRGCSGEPNRLLRAYHSGASDDLEVVVQHVLHAVPEVPLSLVGFSLGGNLTLKYLGERGARVHPRLWRAVTFSAPCHLAASSIQIGRHWLYMSRFLISLRRKIRAKMKTHPGEIDDRGYHRLRNFKHFDDRYTAPLNGFRDAEDYWARASSKPYLPAIRVPALLINAWNDPFLTWECFPIAEARESPWFYLEAPLSGGHVGFVSFNKQGRYWSEQRTVEFLRQALPSRAATDLRTG